MVSASFIAFVPLSNWVRGFDRYRMRFSKELIPESRYPDCFYMIREGEDVSPALSKVQGTIARRGVAGDRPVALRTNLPVGPDGMVPNQTTGTGIGWRWPRPWIPLRSFGLLDESGVVRPTRHEMLTSLAYALQDKALTPWNLCKPRSFSVLPIALACNARCAFCFSKASVSEIARAQSNNEQAWALWARNARVQGATRAVITGGGEPTLLGWAPLARLTEVLSREVGRVLLITNGSCFAELNDDDLTSKLRELHARGLTRLAISRHGIDAAHDAHLMGLPVDGARVARASREAVPSLGLRAICVLQQGGVDSPDRVERYLHRASREGFSEVCFKELYVASLSENPWAPNEYNLFCERNQIPLSIVVDWLLDHGFMQREALPWGSPVFEGEIQGKPLRVAAYTEPSVGWERSHGVVRSWNLMSDGACFASLEDPASRLCDEGLPDEL